jgi:spermidine synthase
MINKFYLFSITSIVAFCSIVFQLTLSSFVSNTFDNSHFFFSISTGLYILALGVGVFFYKYIKNFILVEILLIFFSLSSFFAIYLSIIYLNENIAIFISCIFIFFIGFFSGLEIPILANKLSFDLRKNYIYIFVIDYFFSLVGSLIFSLYFLSSFSLFHILLITVFFNSLAIIIFIFYSSYKKIFLLIPLFLIFIIFIIFNSNTFINLKKNYLENVVLNLYFNKQSFTNDSFVDIDIIDTFNTPYQNVSTAKITYTSNSSKIVDHCTLLNKHLQVCDSWTEKYHTQLCLQPLRYINKKNSNVLILGGGDLNCAKSILDSDSSSNITLVDLDEKFINFMQKNINFNTSLINIIHSDAFSFLSKNKKKYDLIIYDLPDITNHKLLPFTSIEFFSFINNSLNSNGLYSSYHNIDSSNTNKLKNYLFNQYGFFNFDYSVYSDNYFDNFLLFSRSNIDFSPFVSFRFISNTLTSTDLYESSIFKPNFSLVH